VGIGWVRGTHVVGPHGFVEAAFENVDVCVDVVESGFREFDSAFQDSAGQGFACGNVEA
jgi:hypothetical protein